MRIVAISDTHGKHHELNLPEGDVLIHAGDFTSIGSYPQFLDFFNWFRSQKHKYKIFIAGNHDFICQKDPYTIRQMSEEYGIYYLDNSPCLIDGILFYGSPITPIYGNWAFTLERGPEIRRYWDNIPSNTDVLITHGPPMYVLDKTMIRGDHAGCADLRDIVFKLKPKLHIFGHIHEQSGLYTESGIRFINASCLDFKYNLVHYPKVIDI